MPVTVHFDEDVIDHVVSRTVSMLQAHRAGGTDRAYCLAVLHCAVADCLHYRARWPAVAKRITEADAGVAELIEHLGELPIDKLSET